MLAEGRDTLLLSRGKMFQGQGWPNCSKVSREMVRLTGISEERSTRTRNEGFHGR